MSRDAYLEDKILSADPVEIICMLYDRAIHLVEEARTHLAAGDIRARSSAISKALEVLAELQGSLNHQAGGEISRNLERLYQHMRTRLITANVKQQDAPLAEVESLLNTLAEAWKGITNKPAEMPAAPPAPSSRWEMAAAGHSDHGWKA